MSEQYPYQDQAVIDECFLQESRDRFNTILEQLEALCDKPLDTQADRLLTNLWTFFSRRFDRENKIMQQSHNPIFEIHHQQHLLFLDHLSWSIETAIQNNTITKDFCDFLSHWVELHHRFFDTDLCISAQPE